jgi:methionyl aminopeptidase
MEKLESIRTAGIANRSIINAAWNLILSGCVTGIEVDFMIGEMLAEFGLEPVFKGYHGFPANVCISVDDAIVHGIPTDEIISPTSLVKIDMGARLNSWCVDAAASFSTTPKHLELINDCQSVLQAGMDVLRPGTSLFSIALAMQNRARRLKINIFPSLGGHYIGQNLHEDPWIPMSTMGCEPSHMKHLLKEGDVICLEPIVTKGSTQYETGPDGWTLNSVDKLVAAHQEHTLLITTNGYEIIS